MPFVLGHKINILQNALSRTQAIPVGQASRATVGANFTKPQTRIILGQVEFHPLTVSAKVKEFLTPPPYLKSV